MRRALAGVLFAVAFSQGSLAAPAGFAPIAVRTIPIATFLAGDAETHFGSLEFRGGLELVSRDGAFGALSGLDFAADGKTLYAVADTGFWFAARLVEQDGRPVGLEDAKLAAMLGGDGKPPATKAANDAEGLRLIHDEDGGDMALVSYEQTVAVRAFAGPDVAGATPKRLTLPKFVKGLRRNQGLEAIAVAPTGGALGGATVVIAERSLDAEGNHRGFILSGPKTGAFALRRSDDFDVSDAVFLPEGDLLVLERRFSFSAGFAMRIRRIAVGDIRPGALVDGPNLIEADDRNQIDNMEGLAVRLAENGETLLTLVSDDNHNLLQRTLLLQFALKP